jgi:hypothetical protein
MWQQSHTTALMAWWNRSFSMTNFHPTLEHPTLKRRHFAAVATGNGLEFKASHWVARWARTARISLMPRSPPNARYSLAAGGNSAWLVRGGWINGDFVDPAPPNLLAPYSWRVAMLLGAAAVPFGLRQRTTLPETLHGSKESNEPDFPTSRAAEARSHTRVMVLSFIVLGGWAIGNYVFVYINTFAQPTLHLPERVGLATERWSRPARGW